MRWMPTWRTDSIPYSGSVILHHGARTVVMHPMKEAWLKKVFVWLF